MLPNNIASRMNMTIPLLNKKGHQATGVSFVYDNANYASSDSIDVIVVPSNFIKRLLFLIFIAPFIFIKLLYQIYKTDLIHWFYGSSSKIFYPLLLWTKFLKKPALIEFCGADIRYKIAEKSKYIDLVKHRNIYTDKEKSLETQRKFSFFGFQAMTFGVELEDYIDKNIFKKIHKTERRVDLKKLQPHFPDSEQKRIKIIHVPSHSLTKGTDFIEQAIEKLQNENLAFDYISPRNLKHDDLMKLMAQADIVIDQILIGDYGTTTLEAMALGKAVICYIREDLRHKYPADLPVIQATIENLVDILGTLINDRKRLHSLGKAGRAYVEKHHDPDKIVDRLIEIYKENRANK